MNGLRIHGLPDWVYTVAGAVLFVCGWQLICSLHLVPVSILPSPATVVAALWSEAGNGRLASNVIASLFRLVSGFAIGAAVGICLGLLAGTLTAARAVLMPLVELLRPIPPLAWIPLALIWFGIGEPSKLFLIALTACFPVLVATFKGVEQIDPTLIRAARSLDVPQWRMLVKVVLPAAMPDVVTGLRLGWTLGTTILVGAEMIAASSGLGFMIMDGMNSGRFDLLILGILPLGTISVVADGLFGRLSRSRLLRWHAGLERAEA